MKKLLSSQNLISRVFIILFSSVLTAYLLLCAVYCIPTSGNMQRNMTKSVKYFQAEGDYPDLMSNYNSRLDNWTDIIMLLEASYETNERNPFVALLKSEHITANGKYPLDIMIDKYLSDTNNFNYRSTEYARYWHGYLLTLKPLLFLFDYGVIRSINSSIILLLFIYLIYSFFDRKEYIFPFMLLFLFLNPVSVMLSLQYSTVTIITFVALIIIKKYYRKLYESNNQFYLFLLIGSLTSFFDFLTFPILSLGIPLLVWITLCAEKNLNKSLKEIITLSFLWLLGYGVMWSSKWLLASAFTEYNVIANALEAINDRTSNMFWEEHITLFSTIYRNLGVSFQPIWFLLVIILFFRFLCCKNVFKRMLDSYIYIYVC